jgi:serine/threonine protein kinase
MNIPRIDIGRWKSLALLGCGRVGAVSLYRDGSGALQAVKEVSRAGIGSQNAAKRIMREKEVLAALTAVAGIATLRGTWTDANALYFILEPALAGPLHKHIRASRQQRFTVQQTLFYAAEIAAALAAMHAMNMMHRDLKASNLVISDRGHILLVDLGSAKQVAGLRDSTSTTLCGTTHAMAPEMLARTGHAMCVDWWAFGVLIHEMLAGAPPFGYGAGAGGEAALCATISSSTVASVSHLLQALPLDPCNPADAAAVDVLRQLLVPEPSSRLGWHGAAEVLAHPWFDGVNWAAAAAHSAEPVAFNRCLGELELAGLAEDCEEISGMDIDQRIFADF